MGERAAIGLDVGGSSLKVASWEGGTLRLIARTPHVARGGAGVVAAIAAAVKALPPELASWPLGVSIAGRVREGVVVRSGNLSLESFSLAHELGRLGVSPAAILSDARATGLAALLEDGSEPVRLALSLGTGVGGALLVSGELVRDEGLGHGLSLAGEAARAPCPLGHERCLEAFVSAPALVRDGRAVGLVLAESSDLEAQATSGDARAALVLERAGERLAEGALAALEPGGLAATPALLVLSGGVATSGRLVATAAARLRSARVRVVTSRFGALAAVAGSAIAAVRSR